MCEACDRILKHDINTMTEEEMDREIQAALRDADG